MNHVAAAAVTDHGTNNFATIRTTSIVTKQQKEHMQVDKTCLNFILHIKIFLAGDFLRYLRRRCTNKCQAIRGCDENIKVHYLN